MNLLDGVCILQIADENTPGVALKAIDFAGQMALQMGASVEVDPHFSTGSTFLSRGKSQFQGEVANWSARGRIVLSSIAVAGIEASVVTLECNPDATEATLFTESGFADLLGDPEREPLIPRGDFAAGTVGLALLSAICAEVDEAVVDAVSALSWVNWKAALAGDLGKDIHRQGDRAEWPVLKCADGYFALVYTDRDWDSIVEMVDNPALADEKFSSFRQRARHQAEFMTLVEAWAAKVTKSELVDLFEQHQIPAAPVLTAQELLVDPLLLHRGAFAPVVLSDGTHAKTPVLPHRIVARSESEVTDKKPAEAGKLPLAGFRVLDLGIITAGAGVSALLADMGAEVLKIEADSYPDPFRAWAGDAVSPFFKGNNRNKKGIALDLKSEAGKASFLELVKTADVVVENFRRGVLDRLGFEYETLRHVNPDIILASISGQGLTGPGSGNSSYGSTLEASSGFSASVCYEGGAPYITGRNVNYPDQTVVIYAASVIAAALSQTNRGMNLDICQRDVAVFLSGGEIEAVSAGMNIEHGGRQATGKVVGSQMLLSELARNSPAFLRSPNGDLVKGFPFQLKRTPMTIYGNSPLVGEHTRDYVNEAPVNEAPVNEAPVNEAPVNEAPVNEDPV